MAGELTKGAVLAWDGFEFRDGGDPKDKLFVVLGAREGCDYLVAITTSQRHRKSDKHGCDSDAAHYFIPGTGKDFFVKDTWVLLFRVEIVSSVELIKRSLEKRVRVVGNLREDIANAIRNCLKTVDDVSPAYLELL
jgi:hypothetical protein